MTHYQPVRSGPPANDHASTDTSSSVVAQGAVAKDKAVEVAQTGQQAATEVAQTAADAGKQVAQETKKQATDLVGATRDQLGEQVHAVQSSLVENLRSLADQLSAMTDHVDANGTAVDLAGTAKDRARGTADWLDAHEPNEVLDQVRQFGRERSGVFLLGAVAAGVAAGRLTRSTVAVHTDSADAAPAAPDSGAPANTHDQVTSARSDGRVGTVTIADGMPRR